jgi:transposase-like protein
MILLYVRWYLVDGLRPPNLEEMMAEHGLGSQLTVRLSDQGLPSE